LDTRTVQQANSKY